MKIVLFRVVAGVIDFYAAAFLMMFYLFVLIVIPSYSTLDRLDSLAVLIAVYLLVLIVFPSIVERRFGGTFGERAFNLESRYSRSGEPKNVRIAVRNIVNLVDIGLFPMSLAVAIRSSSHRTIGDRLSGTTVVRNISSR